MSARPALERILASPDSPEILRRSASRALVMTVERRFHTCMASQTKTAERDWPTWPHYAKMRKTICPKRDYGWCDVPRSSRGEICGESRCGCASVKSPKVTFGWKCGFARKCADAGLAEAGGRRAVLAYWQNSRNLDLTQKICYDFVRQEHTRTEQVKGK